MFIDRLKTFGLAALAGSIVAASTATLAVKAIASLNQATPTQVFTFAFKQPIGLWPGQLVFAAVVASLAGLFLMAFLFYFLQDMEWEYRPKNLKSDKSARELLRKACTGSARIFGGKYGTSQKEFFASVEDRGLVVGPPGTGKTAFLFNQILRFTDQKLNFVCVDIKPELHTILASTLLQKGYRVLRLNPAADDPTADHWNPLDDVTDETEIMELCNALLPVRDPRDAPFTESQRDWLKAAVFHVAAQKGSLPSAFALLASVSDPTQLIKLFETSESSVAQRLGRRLQAGLSGQKPDPLILSGLTGVLRSLDFLALPGVKSALGHSDFSVRELGKSENPSSLFLQLDESKLGALGAVLSFFMNGIISSLISTSSERKPVALFLDELGNMPQIPNLGQKLNTIRSRLMPTWMYFQTVEQIERQYGAGAASVFLAACNFQMFFRLNDQETRELVSKLVGKTSRVKKTVSIGKGTGAVTTTHEEVNVIEPHALGQLGSGQVVTLYSGASARGCATPHYVDFPKFRK